MRLAVTYETLGHVEECSGRFNDAVTEFALAGKVWEGMRPERTPELIRNMERRAELLDQLRKKGEASYLREKIVNVKQQLAQEIADRLAAAPPPLEIEALPDPVALDPAKTESELEDQNELPRLSASGGGMTDFISAKRPDSADSPARSWTCGTCRLLDFRALNRGDFLAPAVADHERLIGEECTASRAVERFRDRGHRVTGRRRFPATVKT